MSLLREIQDDAVNSNVKVSDLLRKCKILGYRLGNEDFKKWVEMELNGYSSNQELPKYRMLEVQSKGDFIGVSGRRLINADIPTIFFPKKHHEDMKNSLLMNPIAEIEALINESYKEGNSPREPWNSDFVVLFGKNIYQNYFCVQAWKEICVTQLIGIIDLIKTKILNFVLEIEVINPYAGEAALNSNPIPQEKMSQIFNINISGNVGNLSSGNHNSTIQQEATNTQLHEDFMKLIFDLKESNIEDDIALELEKRIEQLGAVVGTSQYKNSYNEFMGFISNHVTVLGFITPFIPMLTSHLI